jgi:hypothetical protein
VLLPMVLCSGCSCDVELYCLMHSSVF